MKLVNIIIQIATAIFFAGCITVVSALEIDENSTASQWQHVGDDEGVALFERIQQTQGLLPFKATAQLNVPYERIVMALVDAERKPDWAPKLKTTAIHKVISSNEFVYSEYYTTPWPFMDREFLLHGMVTYEPGRIVFSASNAQDTSLTDAGHLTANIQELIFVITPVSDTQTRVEFTFAGDMGGWIPDFVKTIIQKRWPVRFIQALSVHVTESSDLETDRYRSLKKK